MSLRSLLTSRDAHQTARGLQQLLERVERLERQRAVQPGQLIGETEHGDLVYAVARDEEPKPEGLGAVLRARFGL